MESSLTKQRGALDSFARWLGERTWGDVTRDDINRFIDGKPGISARTRYGWLSILHTFYTWGILEGHLTDDPTERIVRPKLRPGLPRPITDGDLEIGLACAEPDLRAWITLGAYAGLRCLEIANLQRHDILDSLGLLRICGKGRKERLVPIHPLVQENLRRAVLPRSGYVFTRPNQTAWTPALVSRRINAHFADLSIDATAHQLRHWFASQAYAATNDIRTVQELLGHASPMTTTMYAAFSQEFARDAVAQLPVSGR